MRDTLHASSLGPRDLKNIRDAIYAYRIVVDAESNLARKAVAGTARKGKRRVLIYSVIAVLAVLALLAAFRLSPRARSARELREQASREGVEEAALIVQCVPEIRYQP